MPKKCKEQKYTSNTAHCSKSLGKVTKEGKKMYLAVRKYFTNTKCVSSLFFLTKCAGYGDIWMLMLHEIFSIMEYLFKFFHLWLYMLASRLVYTWKVTQCLEIPPIYPIALIGQSSLVIKCTFSGNQKVRVVF